MHLMKILLVEDDKLLNHHLTTLLTEAQNQVHSTDSAQVALHYAADYPIDVGIIDLGLPDMDGLQLISRLREQQIPFPIIVLTARGNWQDKVEGLEAGADDYLVKPFEPKELVARIRTRLRPTPQATSEQLRVGDLTVDVDAHEVRRGTAPIALTPLEFQLLVALASKPQQVFSREMLLEQVWGYHYKADTRLVNVHVQRLRAKVELDPDNPKIVTTVRGVGYRAGAVV